MCSICPKLCMFQVNQKTGVTIDKTVNEVAWDMCRFSSLKQDHLKGESSTGSNNYLRSTDLFDFVKHLL